MPPPSRLRNDAARSRSGILRRAPREFLTGFHKRKVQKKEDSKKKREEREKQERLEMRREVRTRSCPRRQNPVLIYRVQNRRTLAERAAQNAAEVEAAYGAVGTPSPTLCSRRDSIDA